MLIVNDLQWSGSYVACCPNFSPLLWSCVKIQSTSWLQDTKNSFSSWKGSVLCWWWAPVVPVKATTPSCGVSPSFPPQFCTRQPQISPFPRLNHCNCVIQESEGHQRSSSASLGKSTMFGQNSLNHWRNVTETFWTPRVSESCVKLLSSGSLSDQLSLRAFTRMSPFSSLFLCQCIEPVEEINMHLDHTNGSLMLVTGW